MNPSDRRCLICLLIGVFVFSCLKISPSSELSNHPAEAVRFKLDLNSASPEELVLLPGIGEVRAAAIIKNRDEFGPFESVDELRRIKGIGPKTLSGLTGMVFVHQVTRQAPGSVAVRNRSGSRVERRIAALPESVD